MLSWKAFRNVQYKHNPLHFTRICRFCGNPRTATRTRSGSWARFLGWFWYFWYLREMVTYFMSVSLSLFDRCWLAGVSNCVLRIPLKGSPVISYLSSLAVGQCRVRSASLRLTSWNVLEGRGIHVWPLDPSLALRLFVNKVGTRTWVSEERQAVNGVSLFMLVYFGLLCLNRLFLALNTRTARGVDSWDYSTCLKVPWM